MKSRPCAVCGRGFVICRPMQTVCGRACANKVPRLMRKAALAAKRKERVDDRAKREAMKTTKELRPEAQTAFNRYIRLRDAGLPCFDCGKPIEPNKLGGSADAGHFLGRGGHPNLALEEDNCFIERKNCNRAGGATDAAKRTGAIARIGLQRVEALEADQTPRHYKADDYRRLRDHYKQKAKLLLDARRKS